MVWPFSMQMKQLELEEGDLLLPDKKGCELE
jgi:hypothetical protein